MRVLVTGVGGLVGSALAEALRPRHEVWGTTRVRPAPEGVAAVPCELSDAAGTAALVAELAPDVVVHAAYGRADLRRDVVEASRSVAGACAAGGASLVALSTDAVFAGDAPPYSEQDRPRPVWPYGFAKLAAEEAVRDVVADAAVVRLALVVSADLHRPDAGTRRLIDAAASGGEVVCFSDEIRSAVRLGDVTTGLSRLLGRPRAERAGFWHLGGPRPVSRLELAAATVAELGLAEVRLRPASAATHPEPRPRDVTLRSRRARDQLGWSAGPAGSVAGHGSPRGRSPEAT